MDSLKVKARAFKKKNKKKLLQLSESKHFDEMMHQAHNEAFAEVNCLECANCCKTTGPLFTNKDIERISGHFKMKPGKFIEQFLRIDEDNDYVLQSVPCTFLGEDNYCSIYDVRPKACREYPHTDQTKQRQIFHLTLKNASICPAVLQMFESIERLAGG